MMRLPRLLPSFTLACLLAAPALPAWAQAQNGGAAAPGQPAAAAPQPNKDVMQAAEDFWHYASVARYELAKASAEKLLGMNAQPAEVLVAFEAVVRDRNRRVGAERAVNLDERLLAWQRIPELKDVVPQLYKVFGEARQGIAHNPAFIEEQVKRLSINRRAYELGLEELRRSGEMAVPVMIAYLRDPARREHHVAIRNALRDLGLKAVSPLLAATEMREWNTLTWVVSALGDIGYPDAIPYLVRVVQDRGAPAAVKTAATQALARLNVTNPNEQNPAQLFVELGERHYNEKTEVRPDPNAKEWYVWSWTQNGLTKVNVPAAIFNEHMTLRATETALRLDESRAEAISLWLAAGYRREVEIPDGANDPLWTEKQPDTHYYAVSSGTQHLNATLARALSDGNAAVAHKAVKSLQEIAGDSNLFIEGGGNETAIFDAMGFPDRKVRFEAAFSVANAVPTRQFDRQDQVVPILAEALGQTGKPGILVIVSPQDKLNQIREKLSAQYNVQGGTTVDAAIGTISALPSVDAILVSEDIEQLDRLFTLTRENVRLASSAIVIRATASEVASPYATLAQQNRRVNVTAAGDDGIVQVIDSARTRAGGLAVDEKLATDYAMRSATVLKKLALSTADPFDLMVAQGALLAVLNDARPELVAAAGEVLALLNSPQAQGGLAAKALDEKTPDEQKILMFKDLSQNAKNYGNHLDGGMVDALTNVVATAPNLEVRSAAAEAHGALNLRTNQVKTLILNHGKK